MNLIKNNLSKNVIVSVSGGCDSICLAHYLLRKGVRTLYHFNHGTKQANEMQKAVETFASDFNLDLIVRKTKEKLKNEAEYREARLEFLREFEGVFAMGHTLDDSTEAYCMRFFNGNPEYLPIPISTELENGTKIIHPFLLTEKRQIRSYIEKNGLTKYVVEDISNHDPKSGRRAWVRNEFLPILHKEQIGLKKIVRKKILTKLNSGLL